MDSGISNSDSNMANLLNTPSKPTAHSAATFAATYVSREARSGLVDDLIGRVHYDVSDLLSQKLGIDKVDDTFVRECVAHLQALPDLQTLRDLVSSKSDTEAKLEKRMYGPLNNICDTIENFSASNARPDTVRAAHRQFVTFAASDDSNTHVKPVHEAALVIPDDVPDIGGIDVGPDPTDPRRTIRRSPMSPRILWRQVSTFIEEKLRASPIPRDRKKPTAVTVQIADYARIILSTRPFQVFAIGICVFGTQFTVCYADRAEILFSEVFDYSVDPGLSVFVRVIRRILWDLSAYDLGCDPSVKLALGQTYYQPAPFPRFEVSMGANSARMNVRCWTTAPERPIWSSLSLFGRGTSVWHVTHENQAAILKVSWGPPGRLLEADIYNKIPFEGHPGVAKFRDGGPALYPSTDGTAFPITVNSLRGNLAKHVDENANSRLQRVVITPLGRPLWTCEWKLLLRAAIAAIKGHAFLCENDILHRDISPGNVYAYAGEEPIPEGGEGFIADLELARTSPDEPYPYRSPVPPDWVERPQSSGLFVHYKSLDPENPGPALPIEISAQLETRHMRPRPGPAMTGTVQFMAQQVLAAVQNNTSAISRTVHHDLESFCWVLVWSIYRKVLHGSGPSTLSIDDRESVSSEFKALFGQITPPKILSQRIYWLSQMDNGFSQVTRFLPIPIGELVRSMAFKISAQNRRDPSTRAPIRYISPEEQPSEMPAPITYPYMMKALNETLADL